MQIVTVPIDDQSIKEPVTVDEVMHALHLATDGRTVNADSISQCITRARGLAEARLNAPIVLTQFRMTVYYEPCDEGLYVPYVSFVHNVDDPVTVTATADGTDTQLTEGTDWVNYPYGIRLLSSVTDNMPDILTILYSDGSYVPMAPVKQAILSAACSMWQGQPVDATAFDGLDPYRRQNVI